MFPLNDPPPGYFMTFPMGELERSDAVVDIGMVGIRPSHHAVIKIDAYSVRLRGRGGSGGSARGWFGKIWKRDPVFRLQPGHLQLGEGEALGFKTAQRHRLDQSACACGIVFGLDDPGLHRRHFAQ